MHGDPTALIEFALLVYEGIQTAVIVFFVLDVLVGLVLLAWLHKKRHLWWSLPLLNVVAWLVLSGGPTLDPAWIHVPALAVALFAAGMAAMVLSLIHVARREIRFLRGEAKSPGDLPASFNRPAATTPYPSFKEGILAPWEGFTFLCRYPGLWKYGIIPILLNIIITLLVLMALLAAVVVSAVYLYGSLGEGAWWRVLEVVLILALATAAVVLAIAIWLMLEGILCGHFYTRLARQIELKLGTPEHDLREVSFLYQVSDSVIDVGILIAVNMGLLLLHLVPIIGSIAAFCVASFFNAYWIGLDYFGFSLSQRGMRRAEQRAYCRAHLGHTLGLGTAVILLHLVPIVGSVLLTTAAAGAVLLRERIELADALPPATLPAGA